MTTSPHPGSAGQADDVVASEELFAPVSRDVELCYQTWGDQGAQPLLMVMGLGGPMTWWTPDLCTRLAHAGFYVVRYDNRDVGRSTRVGGRVGRAALLRAFAGLPTHTPYALADLADDAAGLLDHLGLDSAHVAGASMGGMIAQTLAIARPTRVRSLTSIMSTTGRRAVGWQSPALLPTLALPRGGGRDAYVESSVALWRLIGSPGYPRTTAQVREQAERTFDRGVSQQGTLRQMLAIATAPDRAPALARLDLPAAVIHGAADKMVNISGGRATAAALREAELVVIEQMGHDLPAELYETFVAVIARTAARARQPRADEPGPTSR